jgi:NADH-quinone oxidoreductase subunit M
MKELGFPMLSMVVFLPLAGALVTLFLRGSRRVVQIWAAAIAGATLALACLLWVLFDSGQAGLQFVDRVAWIEPLGISYHVGLDGINLWMLLLTALLHLVAVLISGRFLAGWPGPRGPQSTRVWARPRALEASGRKPSQTYSGPQPEEKSEPPDSDADARPFFFFLLALETGVLGVFVAMDLILFYLFWEAMLVPAYFLIGRWGGERRTRAALKFFLYTLAGSALMLVAIIALAVLNYQDAGVWTFDLLSLYNLPLPWLAQVWLFLAFALAFAVKAPVWPLHTWLPDAYVESPTPVTILLAGVLSKMGVYGLIRFCLPLFPSGLAFLQPWIWLLAIAGILYGSLVALAQRDMKRLVAYSSLAHMGLIVAGVIAANAQGVQGALIQSVSHGLTVTALFFVTDLLQARRGTRSLADYGGLWRSLPLCGTLLLTVIMASIGLPGLSGFPGEFTMLVGIFRESVVAGVFATLGIVLGAWYMLNLFRRAFAGPPSHAENRILPDLHRPETALLLPLVALMFVIGILPGLILQPTAAAVGQLLHRAEERGVVLVDESATSANFLQVGEPE